MLKGQVFPADQAPPSVKWMELNTDQFQLIFPKEITEDAKQVATTLTDYIKKIQEGFAIQPKKISIILDNQGVVSNGFVQLAPRKSEFMTTPPVETDPQKWLEQLAIHEYRHVVQFDNLTGKLKAPLELLALAFFGITLPPWLYEGDAVLTETLLTEAGRGRLPSWEMPLRANLLSGRFYPYQKDFLGSYKSITPDYYVLGYFMLTKLRRDHGNSILDSLFSRIRAQPLKPYNVSQNWKKISGYTTRQWHAQTMRELAQKWHTQWAQIDTQSYSIFDIKTVDETDEFYLPQTWPSKGIVTLYQTRHSVKKLIITDADGTRTLPIKIGKQLSPYFHLSNGKITWDEMRKDPRYHKRTYNVINLYDIHTQKQSQLTHMSRYFSPRLSPSADRIAAIEVDKSNQISLVILNVHTGDVQQKIVSPHNRQLQRPAFDASGSRVVCSYVDTEGSGIIEFNLDSGSPIPLLSQQEQQIQTPIYAGNQIIFKAHYNGIDNLYAYDRTTKEITQLSFAKYGAFEPHYNAADQSLWFNLYTPNGFRVSHIALNTSKPKPVDYKDTFIAYFKPLEKQDTAKQIEDRLQPTEFTTKAYSGLKRLFNFHSLSLAADDDFRAIQNMKPQLTFLSDNLLNTISLRAGVAYNAALKSPEYTASVEYRKFYPIIRVEYQNASVRMGTKINATDTALTTLQWREGKTSVGVHIPLNFNRHNQNYELGFSTTTSYTSRDHLNRKDLQDRFVNHVAFPIRYRAYFGRNTLRALWDLAPRWGQNVSIVYESYPFDDRIGGELAALTSTFYFPGLMRNHSLQARFNYQHTSDNFRFSNTIPMVSGYDYLKASLPRNTLLLDYAFPLSYPDWSLGNLAYIKRFRGGFFSDFEDFGRNDSYAPRTFGAEIRADMNLLRFYLPIFDLGIKAIYVNEPNPQKWIFQFGFAYSY